MSILILTIAVFWFFIIVMLKIAGPKRVGFFTGRLIRPNSAAAPETGVEVVMENEAGTAPTANEYVDHIQRSFNRRVIFVRLVFVLCGILTIVASILFYTKGVTAFQESINAMTLGVDVSLVNSANFAH